MTQQGVLQDDPQMKLRWYVLLGLIFSMMAVANSQYAWTLFTGPLQKEFKVSLAIVQVTLKVFIGPLPRHQICTNEAFSRLSTLS
jgi:hypothetical protein